MYVDPKHNEHAGNLRWLMAYCKPDLPRAVGGLTLYAVSAAMALVTPLISARIVDQVIEQHQLQLLAKLCILMIVVTVVRDAAYYGNAMWMERFGQNTVFRLVSDEYEKLHTLDFNYFNHTRTGDIMSRMTSDTDAIRHLLSWVSYQAINCVVMFVGALVMMTSIDWRLALALACVTPFLFVLTRKLSQHAKPLFLAIRNSLASMNSMVEENIEGNRVVKAFVREDYETEKFDERNDDYMERNMDMARNTRRYMPWLDGLGFSLQLITIALGGFLVLKGNMTLGGLVAFNSYLWMIDSPIRQSGWLVNNWQRFNASCVKIRRLLTATPRIREPQPADHDDASVASVAPVASAERTTTRMAAMPDHIDGAIRFEHVDFAFPDDPETPILTDIDFAIPAGARLGILGETGAGKSTLVNMIARFYDPTRGRVLIDGVDARDWPLRTLRSQVSVVAQDTFLFSDTIGGNISFGVDGAHTPSPEYIRHIAFIAGADDFIERMPEGYDTVVGERGVGLSGGQKQRLSLARAIADDPSILIMDDTTSAVDMETEAKIRQHLNELDGDKTIVTIAHRISSIKDSDLILVLEHGHIVERGTHEELVAKHGRYWAIYHKQLGAQSGQAQGYATDDGTDAR
ncbi:ABC transporter ATP-binding protein [Bifidobacterium choerinum]|uniref:Multidrug ABC transporter ATP-binding protein n=1 Tax=Bifidobacterium choerinum TaxID=35760 RepID=A0A2D3D4A1_9BIFI|nr:ABC transporter ATP-binding protein [Bifidobacterium choerinum]ATU19884.1 multidrug ABC transporter ATP-binding protein [Bifidobacterium choerinum]